MKPSPSCTFCSATLVDNWIKPAAPPRRAAESSIRKSIAKFSFTIQSGLGKPARPRIHRESHPKTKCGRRQPLKSARKPGDRSLIAPGSFPRAEGRADTMSGGKIAGHYCAAGPKSGRERQEGENEQAQSYRAARSRNYRDCRSAIDN